MSTDLYLKAGGIVLFGILAGGIILIVLGTCSNQTELEDQRRSNKCKQDAGMIISGIIMIIAFLLLLITGIWLAVRESKNSHEKHHIQSHTPNDSLPEKGSPEEIL
jgi:hypothetical protein